MQVRYVYLSYVIEFVCVLYFQNISAENGCVVSWLSSPPQVRKTTGIYTFLVCFICSGFLITDVITYMYVYFLQKKGFTEKRFYRRKAIILTLFNFIMIFMECTVMNKAMNKLHGSQVYKGVRK